ncbi:putative zinc-finger of transcription factor IIIC complex-domain-containing protein [Trametes elegans]|nr:putative zinc-finger of transcription factor IIIC complex-domain-containing protein [Trametes elegans]
MSDLAVYTTLSLPSVSIPPSVKSLHFSDDGQAVLLTKYAVYVLTPDAGVNVEQSSVTKQTLDSKLPPRGAPPLGWLRTLVEFDRSFTHQWPAECQDWGSVCLGSLDPSLRDLALSPSHLTSAAGCLLALLNSNLELTIWGATKNFLTGEWLLDATSVLGAAVAGKESSSALSRTLKAQSTCVEWSSQPVWGLTPAPSVDASLLAVGNRAGSITFLRYDGAREQVVVVDSATVSDRWVSHLAWSPWNECPDGTREAMLACGAADGSVTVLEVRQTLAFRPSSTKILPEHELCLSLRLHDEKVCEADTRALTGLKWANPPGRNPILIYHKTGTLHLWSAQPPHTGSTGSKVLFLRTQKRSVGSSALCPASGICYFPNLDLSVASLSDGSFHVVYRVSGEPTLDPPSPEAVSSDNLSAISRSVFQQAEPEKVTSKDVDRINAMTAYDGGSTFMWTYEASRPTDFSYKHEAKHVSTLVVAQMWEEDLDERIIHGLAERVGNSKSGTGEAPIARLRSILLHLRDPQRIARLYTRVLDVLHHAPFTAPPPNFNIPPYEGDWGSEFSRDFAQSLSTHLFGWDSVLSQRMRYAVAAFCKSHSAAPDVQQQFADAAARFVSDIRAHLLLTLLRHLSAVRAVLNASDAYFARRTVLLASSPGTPPELAKEAEELASQLPRAANPGASPDAQDSLDERCPACHAAIPLQDPEGAVCANGHVWARCCVTAFLLATPQVRTCVGCTRKAFLPVRAAGTGTTAATSTTTSPASWLPDTARGSSVVRDLLDATRRCPFCGNNFVTLV